MDRIFDWIGDRLKDLDIDVSISSGDTTVGGTTSGAEGGSGVWWQSNDSTGQIGDVPVRPDLLISAAGLAVLALLSR